VPERWERELRKLRSIEVSEPAVRERVDRGPTGDRPPARRDRIVAGAVAAVVAVGAIALLWQALPRGDRMAAGPRSLPTLTVTFEGDGTIGDTPSDADPIRRVNMTIAYGDALDEDFTSTTPAGAHVDWVPAEALTPFLPGPSAGSPVRIEADGDDPRVLVGRPSDWPNFDRFEVIETLPREPGDYVLLFEAEYPEGIARAARLVELMAPGTLQLVATERDAPDAATATAFVDGRKAEGFLSAHWFTSGDFGVQTDPQPPSFEEGTSIRVSPGAPVVLGSSATEARAGVLRSYEEYDPDEPLSIDLSRASGTIEGDGPSLLALDVIWRHEQTGYGQDGTEERALFFFPIEVESAREPSPAPAPEESPSPAPTSPGTVVIYIRRTSPESGDPEALARFDGQEQWMCPNGWTVVSPDGESESVTFDCGQDDVFQAPAGSAIVTSGDFAAVNATARVSEDGTSYASNLVPGIEPGSVVTLTYEVEWDDGSEASFWLLVTVSEGPPASQASVLEIRCGRDGAEVLTPVVMAQPDGVHIQVDNPSGAAALEFSSAVSPAETLGGPIADGIHAWPIDPGEFHVECLERVSDTYQGLRTARFEVVDPHGYWVPGTLECDEGDDLLRVDAHDGGGANYVDDETAIRALLHSIEPMDEVRLPFYPEGGGAKDLRYVVVRDDRVIAALFVGLSVDEDPYGSGLTEVTGQACASSGIAQGSIG
jgi:hypothetical protein